MTDPRFAGKLVKVKKLSNNSTIPTRTNITDAGWDLYANENVIITYKQRGTVSTGISIEMPDGYAGLIWPRSGLSVKSGLDVLAGVVDSGYRGEVKVCIYNTSEVDVEIKEGDRIAQIVFQEVPDLEMVEAEVLCGTSRGTGGFGSSGK